MIVTDKYHRDFFIYNNPGHTRQFMHGYWYVCENCGKWCGRDTEEWNTIKDDDKMEVWCDIPWNGQGFIDIHHLHPVCKSCSERLSQGYNLHQSTSYQSYGGNSRYNFNNQYQDKRIIHAEICNRDFDVDDWKYSGMTVAEYKESLKKKEMDVEKRYEEWKRNKRDR